MNTNTTHLLMISGGIDSAILAYYSKSINLDVIGAVFFDYGQEAAQRELHYSRRVTLDTGIPFEPVNISGLKYLFFGVIPTDYHPLMAECECNDPALAHAIAATYAILRGAHRVLVGITKSDVDRFPGLPEYVTKFSEAMSVLNNIDFQLVAPFIDLPKVEVLNRGVALGVDLGNSWACYSGNAVHCGRCPGCRRRQEAFASAKLADPTEYATS
jgi:7-cyano-7-deazaguanine synthase